MCVCVFCGNFGSYYHLQPTIQWENWVLGKNHGVWSIMLIPRSQWQVPTAIPLYDFSVLLQVFHNWSTILKSILGVLGISPLSSVLSVSTWALTQCFSMWESLCSRRQWNLLKNKIKSCDCGAPGINLHGTSQERERHSRTVKIDNARCGFTDQHHIWQTAEHTGET